MLIELPAVWIVILNVGGWLLIQIGFAWLFTRLPAGWFSPSPPFTWEQSGRIYESWLGIRRWKDRLPDGARWFSGGFAKASLGGVDPDHLHRFARETRRAEMCHLAAILCAPVFFLWNPLWGDLVIVAYALAANVPCIVAQRYNRARLLRLMERRR